MSGNLELEYMVGDFYAIATALCWSSAVILFDFSSKRFGSLQLNAIKNLIGIIGFSLTIFIFLIPVPEITRNDFVILTLSGFLGISIGDVLFIESLKKIGSGISAVVSTIYTPFIFIIAFLMFGEKINLQSSIGGILVLSGISISVYKSPGLISKSLLYKGIFYGITAQLFTAYSVLLAKPLMASVPIIYIALYRFIAGFIGILLILFIRYDKNVIIKNFKNGLQDKYVISGSFLGTYLSVIFWLAGFKYTLAARAAIYNQMSTVFIVIMAIVFLDEKLTKRKVFGVISSVLGALLVTTGLS